MAKSYGQEIADRERAKYAKQSTEKADKSKYDEAYERYMNPQSAEKAMEAARKGNAAKINNTKSNETTAGTLTNEMMSAGSGAPVPETPEIPEIPEFKAPNDPSQLYQGAARKGNAASIMPRTAEEAQKAARKGNAAAINGTKFSSENSVPKPYETNAVPKPASPVSPVPPTPPAPAPASIPAGRQVGNSNKDVANAKPGDWIIRRNGEKVILTQAHIDWAKGKFVKSESTISDNPETVPPASNTIQITNKPNPEFVSKENPDHAAEAKANRRILEEKKNTPYNHMSDADYLRAVMSGSLQHPGLKVNPVKGSDGLYSYSFN